MTFFEETLSFSHLSLPRLPNEGLRFIYLCMVITRLLVNGPCPCYPSGDVIVQASPCGMATGLQALNYPFLFSFLPFLLLFPLSVLFFSCPHFSLSSFPFIPSFPPSFLFSPPPSPSLPSCKKLQRNKERCWAVVSGASRLGLEVQGNHTVQITTVSIPPEVTAVSKKPVDRLHLPSVLKIKFKFQQKIPTPSTTGTKPYMVCSRLSLPPPLMPACTPLTTPAPLTRACF